MERERSKKVIKILDFYKTIDDNIKFNENEIEYLNDKYYANIGTICIDGMPKGKGGTLSLTETTVINLPKSLHDTITELEKENKKLCAIKTAILKELNSLPYIHKVIIINFYIKDLQWVQISEQIHYSIRQCKNIRKDALERLSRRFEKNKIISSYKFPL